MPAVDRTVPEVAGQKTGNGLPLVMKKHPTTDRKGPERLGDIVARLFIARGWGRRQERLQLEEAWTEAVGPSTAPHTRLAGIRRGVLEVAVNNGVLLQELAHYQKRRLLDDLRARLPGRAITDLRFRAGAWKDSDSMK